MFLEKNMKVAIVDVKKGATTKINPTAVNIRNVKRLKELWGGADLYLTHSQLVAGATDYDAIILGFNSITQDLAEMQNFIKKNTNAKIFVMCGEYEQTDSIVCRYTKRPFCVVRNYEGPLRIRMKELVCGDEFLNINLIIVRQQNELTAKKYDCVYYGRWRPDRETAFKKYIHNIYLSSTTKNFKFFKHEGCEPKAYIDRLNWQEGKETLNNFRYSLYIEDNYTHTHYNCLANRWYEAGICNNVVIFDADCENTIRRSEIGQFWEQIQPYIVHNGNELQEKINELNKDFEKHLAIQKSWRLAEPLLQRQMIERFKEIVAERVNVAQPTD